MTILTDKVSTVSESFEAPSQGFEVWYRVFKHLPTFKPSARNSNDNLNRIQKMKVPVKFMWDISSWLIYKLKPSRCRGVQISGVPPNKRDRRSGGSVKALRSDVGKESHFRRKDRPGEGQCNSTKWCQASRLFRPLASECVICRNCLCCW